MDPEDKPEVALRRFLAAEATDDEPAAERALGQLFRSLPAVEPKPDFTARLMARIESSPRLVVARARRARDLPRAFRLPLAAALLLAAFSVSYLLPAVLLLGSRLPPGSLIEAGASLWAELLIGLETWSWLGQSAHQLGSAIFEVLGSPPVLLAIALAATLTTLLSRWLWALLEPARRTTHVAFR